MTAQFDIFNARILLVDDQIVNLQLLEQVLNNAGYSQMTFTSNPLVVCALHVWRQRPKSY